MPSNALRTPAWARIVLAFASTADGAAGLSALTPDAMIANSTAKADAARVGVLMWMGLISAPSVSKYLRFQNPCGPKQTQKNQTTHQPRRQRLIPLAADIDVGAVDAIAAQRQQHADPVGEPQMRVSQRHQHVQIVGQRLKIGRIADI